MGWSALVTVLAVVSLLVAIAVFWAGFKKHRKWDRENVLKAIALLVAIILVVAKGMADQSNAT